MCVILNIDLGFIKSEKLFSATEKQMFMSIRDTVVKVTYGLSFPFCRIGNGMGIRWEYHWESLTPSLTYSIQRPKHNPVNVSSDIPSPLSEIHCIILHHGTENTHAELLLAYLQQQHHVVVVIIIIIITVVVCLVCCEVGTFIIHFIVEDTEAQRDLVTCSRSHICKLPSWHDPEDDCLQTYAGSPIPCCLWG